MLGCGRGQVEVEGADSDAGAGLDLAFDVELGGGVRPGDHDGEARRASALGGEGGDFLGEVGFEGGGDGLAIDPFCKSHAGSPLCDPPFGGSVLGGSADPGLLGGG
ncbi:hypothetical protein D3C87_680590 [compost metagenome]